MTDSIYEMYDFKYINNFVKNITKNLENYNQGDKIYLLFDCASILSNHSDIETRNQYQNKQIKQIVTNVLNTDVIHVFIKNTLEPGSVFTVSMNNMSNKDGEMIDYMIINCPSGDNLDKIIITTLFMHLCINKIKKTLVVCHDAVDVEDLFDIFYEDFKKIIPFWMLKKDFCEIYNCNKYHLGYDFVLRAV
jgi:hypothetical protein